jgi:hypothetical protein
MRTSASVLPAPKRRRAKEVINAGPADVPGRPAAEDVGQAGEEGGQGSSSPAEEDGGESREPDLPLVKLAGGSAGGEGPPASVTITCQVRTPAFSLVSLSPGAPAPAPPPSPLRGRRSAEYLQGRLSLSSARLLSLPSPCAAIYYFLEEAFLARGPGS